MSRKELVFAGMAVGALVGFLASVVTRVPIGTDPDGNQITVMYRGWSALLTGIAVPVISAISVRWTAGKWGGRDHRLSHLVPVAILTLLLPVFGPLFGGTGAWFEIPVVTLMGMFGGAFWSAPYALFRRK